MTESLLMSVILLCYWTADGVIGRSNKESQGKGEGLLLLSVEDKNFVKA